MSHFFFPAFCTDGVRYAERHYQKQEVQIPMRDGVQLYTAIYTPRHIKGDRLPIVLMRTPYGCKPYAQGMADEFRKLYWLEYMREGYIIVFQDVRGRYHSGGQFVHLSAQEVPDTYDTIEWLVTNLPQSNGKVGVVGCSYIGFYAFMAGLCGHEALRIVSPQAPVTDWWEGDDFHRNGAFCPTGGDFLRYMQDGEPSEDNAAEATPQPSVPETEYEHFLRLGTVENITQEINQAGPIDFWNQLMQHPDYDAFWQQANARSRVGELTVPAVLMTGGWLDGEDFFGTLRLAQAIRQQRPDIDCRLVIGPWKHGGWMRSSKRIGPFRMAYFCSPSKTYLRTMELPLMNHYLGYRGAHRALTRWQTRYYVMQQNRWINISNIGEPMRLYLQADGGLTVSQPNATAATTAYRSDPHNPVPSNRAGNSGKDYMYEDQRFLASRTDIARFSTPALRQAQTLIGAARVHLEVEVQGGTDADFVVKLIDVAPCGKQIPIRTDIMRGKYRNDFSHPTPLTEGVNVIEWELLDMAYRLRRGHRLMLTVQSSQFPLYDINPQVFTDIYHCSQSDFTPVEIVLHHTRDHASYIELPLQS